MTELDKIGKKQAPCPPGMRWQIHIIETALTCRQLLPFSDCHQRVEADQRVQASYFGFLAQLGRFCVVGTDCVQPTAQRGAEPYSRAEAACGTLRLLLMEQRNEPARIPDTGEIAGPAFTEFAEFQF